ncbi:FtsX-like permease family protein [Chitinophaga sp. 30R24]|uniref:ABC transporter permease n=1 Tax=Chitinophaga sp. 30R24 TaxID=3248838 RepID=UPI003B910BAE
MFRSYLKTAIRNLSRNKLFSGLNILGLATGMTCSILIFLWVQDELSFDRFNKDATHIYRLTGAVADIHAAVVPVPIAAAMRSIPAVKNSTCISSLASMVTIGNKKFDERNMFYADVNFLRIFSFPVLLGDTTNLLSKPNEVVITESSARKYFGSPENAMGKTLHVDNDSKGNDLLVTAVLKDIPHQSHLQFTALLPIQLYERTIYLPGAWSNFDVYAYLQIDDHFKGTKANVAVLEQQVNQIYQQRNATDTKGVITVQPLTNIHLYSPGLMLNVAGTGSIQHVRIFSVVAIFILLIAGINFVNLSTALSGQRAKEVGLRKTVGAMRSQLVLQFLCEALILSIISLIIGLVTAALLLPLFNDLSSKTITLSAITPKMLWSCLGIALVVGLLSGSYPAIYLSSFNPVKVLKGVKMLHGNKTFFRNGLIVVQFSIAVVLMVSTIVVYQQLQFIRHMDIGYNKENLLYVPIIRLGDLQRNQESVKSQMGQYADIGKYTFVSHLPTDMATGTTSITWDGKDPAFKPVFPQMWVDENFVETFGIHLKAGRFFRKDAPADEISYVVNEAALKVMGMDVATAVGKSITMDFDKKGQIIGVVKDFNFKPVQQVIQPLIIRNGSSGNFRGNTGYVVLRTSPAHMQHVLGIMKQIYQQIYTDFPFSFGFIDEDLLRLYIAEQRMGKLFNIFAVLSVIVSCLGLFGLTTFATQKRIREIGVRKVLGASVAGIVGLLSKDFVRLVLLALLIAFPIAWWVMTLWLQGFAFHIGMEWWYFGIAGIIALVISFITISYQSIKAAKANPVKSLRAE